MKNSEFSKIFPMFNPGLLFTEDVTIKKEIEHIYDTYHVSIFDHWLTEEEYINEDVVEYSDTFNEKNKLIYFEYESRFERFYEKLRKEGVFLIHGARTLIEFSGKKEYRRYYIKDIRQIGSGFYRSYIFPSFGVMITPGWNLTHTVHASRPYYKKEEFEKIVKDSGLYILR